MPNQIHIQLDLRRHCIETAARQSYNQKVAQYFKDEQGRGRLEEEIALLKVVLETFDFSRLRGAHPVLAGKSERPVAITLDNHHNIVIMIDGNTIVPLLR
jgi:hypothetical protein